MGTPDYRAVGRIGPPGQAKDQAGTGSDLLRARREWEPPTLRSVAIGTEVDQTVPWSDGLCRWAHGRYRVAGCST
jgi:hypothetical protein